MNVVYFTPWLYRVQGSYGSVVCTRQWKDTWSTHGVKRQGRPSPILGVRCGRFWGSEVQCARVKVVYFTSRLYIGGQGRVVGPPLSGTVYLGHLYARESGQLHSLIFLGSVRYGTVFRRTE